MRRIEVNKGERFGKLTIVKEVEPYVTPSQKMRTFQLTCDCGNTTEVILNSLRKGSTTSCGCGIGKKETHGLSSHYLYKTWSRMKQRCYNPKSTRYENWGGRGIRVCDRWLNSFPNFLKDMGDRPEGMSIDRFPDKDGNYEPDNCRWATIEQQNNNRRTCVKKKKKQTR